MEPRDHAELAAVPAILEYLMKEMKPPVGKNDDPAWRAVFEDAYYLAQRFGGAWARAQRD